MGVLAGPAAVCGAGAMMTALKQGDWAALEKEIQGLNDNDANTFLNALNYTPILAISTA